MEKTLVVLAAGMGSRFGGLKQIEPVGPSGEFIIDYSVYDAIKAGFTKVVFVIRKENFEIFENTIGKRLRDKIKVEYAFQELDVLPFKVDVKREKQFGTAHALYCAKDKINGPFVLITADDYYGQESFMVASSYLDSYQKIAIIGFKVGETMPESGAVKRGVILSNEGIIKRVIESSVIFDGKKVKCTPVNGDKEFWVSPDTPVSMLMLAFGLNVFNVIEAKLIEFLNTASLEKDEFYLTDILDYYVSKKMVDVIKTSSKWLGMTYKDDLENVKKEILKHIESGLYKKDLWGE